MEELIENFLTDSVFERHFSKNTVSAYSNDLLQFSKWVEEQNKTLLNVSYKDLTEYLIKKKIDGYEFSSIARSLFCFRVFFSWLETTGKRTDNPSELLETPKLWTHLPELLTVEEIDELINNIVGNKRDAIRMRAVLEILYGCGLRISELINLKMENIDLQKNYLICFGKGSKERVIPFSKRVRKVLKKWINSGREDYLKGESSEFLFIGQKKNSLSRQQVWYALKQLAKKSGLRKNIYPHIFRHSYATHILAGGGDLRVLQELLGHADVVTTQRYTQVDKSRMLKLYEKFHPRA